MLSAPWAAVRPSELGEGRAGWALRAPSTEPASRSQGQCGYQGEQKAETPWEGNSGHREWRWGGQGARTFRKEPGPWREGRSIMRGRNRVLRQVCGAGAGGGHGMSHVGPESPLPSVST